MIDITLWTDNFLRALRNTFGERIRFVGLQGSYGRGEATDTSDIDMVVILDKLSAEDIKKYNNMLDSLPHRELTCGFLCGKDELRGWDPPDLFQLYYDTTPLFGSFDDAVDKLDDIAVQRAVKIGACNIYHGCVHNMLYQKKEKTLRGLYKSAVFVIQAVCFVRTGRYFRGKGELLEAAEGEEKDILRIAYDLKAGGEVEFEEMSERLFRWCQNLVQL